MIRRSTPRPFACAGVLLMLAAPAWAQPAPSQTPPAQPPGAQPPGVQPPGVQPPAAPSASAPAAPAPGPAWLPRDVAQLQALDKVNARSQRMRVKVGDSARFGSLTVAVQSCVVRPPDRPADAAAFLRITDAHADAPGFHGWMFASDPAVSMLEHPIYDVRVLGCGAAG